MENENRCAGAAAGERVLWLDCSAGIAGDMLVGALLDAGADRAAMDRALASLPVDGFEVRVSRVEKAGQDCCDFDVVLDEAHENHDHDMAYLHGEDAEPATGEGASEAGPAAAAGAVAAGHAGAAAHGRDAAHAHGRAHHAADHAHEHRGLADILPLIDAADMTEGARVLARRTFRILAEAEADAHEVSVDEVAFHEVGAVDSIVDIVAASVLLDSLHIDRAVVPLLIDGCGTIRCQHGIIPVPVPATLSICLSHGLPLSPGHAEGELVTPTGAALVAALEPWTELPEHANELAVGLGAGKRTYEIPSVLRAVLLEAPSGRPEGVASASLSAEIDPPTTVVKLECDIDDCAGEQLAYAADLLREAGAREVHWLPLYTKKGRPAWQLQVICAPEDEACLQEVVLRETTTTGLRRQVMERVVLPRRLEEVETPWGPVRVKIVQAPGADERVSPEHEDCAAIARREKLPLQDVVDAVRELAHRH